jgi:hypothetical protein
MCIGGDTPPTPVTPTPTPPPPAVTQQEQSVLESRDRERRRAMSAAGRQSTFLTGGQGVTAPVATATKTLLGQ